MRTVFNVFDARQKLLQIMSRLFLAGFIQKRMIQNIRVQAEKAVQQKQEVRLFRGLPGQWRNNGEMC